MLSHHNLISRQCYESCCTGTQTVDNGSHVARMFTQDTVYRQRISYVAAWTVDLDRNWHLAHHSRLN
ncbi:hypothetical protein D3C80_2125090 [compost metagenome]